MNTLNDLTVFLISSGSNPNYNACLKALEAQSVKFKIDIIKGYRPLSVAFQEMLNRCTTAYYVECDEDMILKPDAIEKMYNRIVVTPLKTAMCCYQLRDVHLDFIIYGVKIYKHGIFKKYPYNLEHISCEMEQLDKIKVDGFSYDLIAEVVGEHSPQWTNTLIFERYLNLMEKFKEYQYSWMEGLPSKLWGIVKKDPSDVNLYALLGAYTSLSQKNKILQGEKDFSVHRKELKNMESFLKTPTTGTLYLTNKCNFKCKFCYKNNNEIEDSPDMSIKTVQELLNKFPSIESLCLCGYGEPLLCSTLKPVMEYLKNKGIFMGLITNGSLLKENLNVLKKTPPNYISISLNAPDKKTHEQFTGTETFDTVIEGISLCVSTKIDTYVSYICTKENINSVPVMVSLAKKLEVKGIYLHNLLPHFKEIKNENFWDLVLTNKDKNIIEELKTLPDSNIILTYPVLINKEEKRQECQLPWKQIGINGNGSISVCSSVYPPNKNNGKLTDCVIWQNEYCQNFRGSLLGEQKEACKKCFRNWKCD